MMNVTVDLQVILQGTILLAFGGGLKMLLTSLGGIRDHLAELNGRTGKMEQWQIDHEKRDEDRFGKLLAEK